MLNPKYHSEGKSVTGTIAGYYRALREIPGYIKIGVLGLGLGITAGIIGQVRPLAKNPIIIAHNEIIYPLRAINSELEKITTFAELREHYKEREKEIADEYQQKITNNTTKSNNLSRYIDAQLEGMLCSVALSPRELGVNPNTDIEEISRLQDSVSFAYEENINGAIFIQRELSEESALLRKECEETKAKIVAKKEAIGDSATLYHTRDSLERICTVLQRTEDSLFYAAIPAINYARNKRLIQNILVGLGIILFVYSTIRTAQVELLPHWKSSTKRDPSDTIGDD